MAFVWKRGRVTLHEGNHHQNRHCHYNGSIDGSIGPQSRRAIYRYQRDNGLTQSGTISQSLLRSLGLQ